MLPNCFMECADIGAFKAFFRRAVQSGKDKVYRCKRSGDCEVAYRDCVSPVASRNSFNMLFVDCWSLIFLKSHMEFIWRLKLTFPGECGKPPKLPKVPFLEVHRRWHDCILGPLRGAMHHKVPECKNMMQSSMFSHPAAIH